MKAKPFQRFGIIDLPQDKSALNPTRQYIFDKYIFLSAVSLLLLLSIAIIIFNGGFDAQKYLYIECNAKSGWCENPIYHNMEYCGNTIDASHYICTQEFLPNGFTAGKKPPNTLAWFQTITFIVIAISFVFNHYKYNRRKNAVL